MKQLFTLLAFMGFSSFAVGQVINTFPYNEDFESYNTCATGCGATCVITGTNAWFNEAGDNLDWIVDAGGTSSTATGPGPNTTGSFDHNPGTAAGQYLYTETSCSGTGYPNRTANLQSPWLDFTALSAPRMNMWYHMWGQSMGTLEIQARTGVNDPFVQVVAPFTDDIDLWQELDVDLIAFAGEDSVQIRFASISGTNFYSDMAIDDITWYEPAPVDLEMNDVDSLQASSCVGFQQAYAMVIQLGSDTIFAGDTIYVGYDDGTNTVADTVVLAADMAPGDTLYHPYSIVFDFTTAGTYNATATCWNSMDMLNGNDTLMFSMNVAPLINSFPYVEDFENGNGGWSINNTGNGTWAFTTPANPTITGAASGDSAFVTGNGTGQYNVNEDSWVEGPCFDFSGATGEEWVSINVWWESENSWDGANLTASTDGGNTWFLVGAFGDPFNWYTDNSVSGGPGGSQQAWTGRDNPATGGNGSWEWVSAKHELDSASFVGFSDVKFRINFGSDGSVTDDGFAFDDFIIAYPPTIDYMPDSMVVCDTSFLFDVSADMWKQVDWSTGAQGDMQAFNMDGTYSITVTDSNNLCTTETFYLEFADYAAPNLGPDRVLCSGDMEILDAGADSIGYTYMWNDGSMMQTLDATLGGTYWVTKDDSVSGCSVTDTVELYQPPVVDFATDTTLFCDGSTVTLDAGIVGGTYIWNTGEATQTIDVTAGGAYAVTVIDSLNCVSLDATALIDDTPMPDLGDDFTMCLNHVITLDATYPGATYSWSTGGSGASEDIDGSALGAGNFTVTVDVTSATGCTGSADVEVTVDPCVGIGENIAGVSVNMFPNPTNGIVTVEVADENATDMTISVLNLQGQVISTEQYNNGNGVYVVTLDLTDVASGYYFVKFENENGVMMHQLIKE